MKTTKVNESIRIAKEGIGECWDDMAGMTGQTPEGQGEGPMTVTINMPGKNISVTTDSADEIANILKLAGIQVGGVSADGEMPGEMPAEMPAEEPAVMYVGAEPTDSGVPGDNDGDGDHDMHDHEIEHEDSESSEEESAEEESGEEDEVEEAVGDKSYTAKGGTVTQTATGLTHQAGSGTYGGTETDSEEKARKDAEQELAKKELPEAVEEIDEETARILQLAGVTNEAQSAAQKAAFAKMIAKKNGGSDKSEDKGEEADKEEEVEESTTETPAPASNSIYGQGVYETSYARILELAGLEESKLMNSPEGTSMDEPMEFDSLPSNRGEGAGNKAFGANRANNQGENPMGLEESTVEQKFQDSMGEYRKFVAESISRKK